MQEEQRNSATELLEKGASAANLIKGAVKTGKAISGMAKGAAVGGPYGAIAAALWNNRKIVGKAAIGIIALLMIPVVFVMMLPGLIFGDLSESYSPADPNNPILNSSAAITYATGEITKSVDSVLADALAQVIARIESDFRASKADQIDIVNPYSTRMLYDAKKLVSMYCAAKKDDFASMSVDDLSKMLRKHMEILYTYTVSDETRVVMTTDPETGESIPLTVTDPETGEVSTVTEKWRIYKISFTGESYFEDRVFALTEEQKELAADYSANLSLFMKDDNFAGVLNSAFARDNEIDISGYTNPSTKNNLDLVQWAIEAKNRHWGYVWGTFGEVLDAALYAYKLNQYPDGVGRYAEFIEANWLGGRTADCVGLIKGYGWLDPQTLEVRYGTNGMPDIGADTMYYNASIKGPIRTIPEIPGVAVWHAGHIGIYIGNGQVIEAMGTRYGVVQTSLSDGRWTHWLKIPYISYNQ